MMSATGDLAEKTLMHQCEIQPLTKTNREIVSASLDVLYGSNAEIVKKMIELSKPG